MISTVWARLPVLAGTGALALTACGLLPDLSASLPKRSGPAPAWSSTTVGGTTALAGNTLAIRDDYTISGVDVRTGKRLWRVPSGGEDATMTIAGDVVARQTSHRLTMIDAASGRTLWTYAIPEKTRFHQVSPRVTQGGVFTNDCQAHGKRCTVTRRDLRTGRVRWRVHGDSTVAGDVDTGFGNIRYDLYVGVRDPLAPPTGRFLAANITPDKDDPVGPRTSVITGSWEALSAGTGRPTGARISSRPWGELIAGRNWINTDNDPTPGDDNCAVRLYAYDVVSGKHRWTRTVFSGREGDGTCMDDLAPDSSQLGLNQALIGTGTRIAALTADGRPQLFDLRTGRTIWRGTTAGVPIAGDGHGILVRAQIDSGRLSMLDFATGRLRWTAPDPGLKGTSASWASAVAGHLVAVTGATNDHPYVLVYNATTGRRLGLYPGDLCGIGNGWVAVNGYTEDSRPYEFIRL